MSHILEGLHGDAELIARQLGREVLSKPDGAEKLVLAIEADIRVRRKEIARELFRKGQYPTGELARAPGESMVSYTSRRKRWYQRIRDLDDTIELTDVMQAQFMLEAARLTDNQVLHVRSNLPEDPKVADLDKELRKLFQDIHEKEERRGQVPKDASAYPARKGGWNNRGNQSYGGRYHQNK